jgi:hypothetical protein
MSARLARLSRTALVVGTLVALVAAGGAAVITTASAAPGTGNISGAIFDSGGYPLAGVKVTAHRDDNDQVAATTTDSAGRYRFDGLATDGDDWYRYRATDPTGRHIAKSSPQVVVKPGATSYHSLTLAAGGIIQGKAFTRQGSGPLVPAKLFVVTADMNEDVNASSHVSPTGSFRVGGLPSGTYAIYYDDDPGVYDSTCYHNIRRTQRGCVGYTRVTVTAGQTTTLKTQVITHKLGALFGTVTDADGQPLEGMKVEVLTGPTDHAVPVTTAADGSWRKVGIDYVGNLRIKVSDPAGTYRTTWYASAVDYAHATPVPLKDGAEVKNLHVTMPKG